MKTQILKEIRLSQSAFATTKFEQVIEVVLTGKDFEDFLNNANAELKPYLLKIYSKTNSYTYTYTVGITKK